jgi:hypothetical protein
MPSPVERRSGLRFPIRMDVTYRLFIKEDRRILSRGKVQTVDISSTGVLLNTRKPYPPGAAAELSIEWPTISQDAIPLQLRLVGSVVRSDERGTAVKILRHGFKRFRADFLYTNGTWPDVSKELFPGPEETGPVS